MSLPSPHVVPHLLESLRRDLDAAGFTLDGLAAYLGPVAGEALRRDQMVPADLLTRPDERPLAALVRLFSLSVEVPFEAVDAALPTLGGDGLVELGLAERTGAALKARCDLQPYGDETHSWWVASDLPETATGRPLEPEHVLGVGGASMTLASWTPRPQVARALDVGTGCGVQALHLSSHADEVVVTDLSARALDFARFNAALAGQHWQVREGSMLDPVRGESFDLVVSNPPFVITPRREGVPVYEYRDGREHGDGIVEGLVRGVGEVLAPGGIAHFLGNWEIGEGADWRQRWRQWLEGIGLDAWVIQRDLEDPAQYAETWARDGGQVPGSWAYEQMYAAWLDDFAARGVAHVGFGIVTMQRPATPREPFVDLMEASGPVEAPMGPAILRGMRARTWLAEHVDDDLFDIAWSAAPDVTLESHRRPGASDPSVLLVRQGGGLGRAWTLDTVGAALLDVCDGDITAGQALTAISGILDVDDRQARRALTPLLRELVADGVLIRAGAPQ